MTVTLIVRNASGLRAPVLRRDLERIAAKACALEGFRDNVEISLLYCDDLFIRGLNKTYRRQDKPTDVLSFAQNHSPGKGPRPLGDIVISLETVERHCAETGESPRHEARLLFCHGVLHLLGHDHAAAEDKTAMMRRQAECLGIPFEAAWPPSKAFARKRRPLRANR